MFQCNLLSQELYFYENRDTNAHWDALSILRSVSQGDVIGYHIQRQEPLVAELTDFVKAVQQGTEPKVTGRDALQTLRAAIDFIDSGRNNQVHYYRFPQAETVS